MARSQKNVLFVLFLMSFVFISVFLYSNLESNSRSELSMRRENEVEQLKGQIRKMNEDLEKNNNDLSKLKQEMEENPVEAIEKENEIYDLKAEAKAQLDKDVDQIEGEADHKAVEEEHGPAIPAGGNKVAVVHNVLHPPTNGFNEATFCALSQNYSHTLTDIQMLDVYDAVPFDNVDGGVWKQGWEITYDKEKVMTEKPLRVVVIPHSHCDPGWIKTFEQYYLDQVEKILTGMVTHLTEWPDMKFIYAEVSFFEMWWRKQDAVTHEKVKKLLANGQFELVSGGWVMTDEANSHYFATITEMFEGHEWIRNHLGAEFVPKSHWSIDPFGLSPSVPFLMGASNITDAVIQRVHYSIKKYLAKNKQLEFTWRQMWGASKTDVRTHAFPFYSYDVPHTCGPEPSVCCQFDFKRLPGGGHSCPWNVPPEKISQSNVEKRAFMLYDQYRKKSQLYDSNVVLIPLGDDFRYDTEFEWQEQYRNYKQLFEFMNSKKEWNVQASFGTLSDYFKLLDSELKADNKKLPVLTGDFFTYADRDDHYWSGYFTSRPFYKSMDRVLQGYLRAAEIAYSLSSMRGNADESVYEELVLARRACSVFQHHDGVTGTAKDHVVIDYGGKMLEAIEACEKVLSASVINMMGAGGSPLKLDEQRKSQDALPTIEVLTEKQSFVVFNSLPYIRSEPICVRVNHITLGVVSSEYKEIEQQIAPVFLPADGKLALQKDVFEICFVAPIPPLSFATFTVDAREIPRVAVRVKDVNVVSADFDGIPIDGEIKLNNKLIEATFSQETGFLESVTPSNHKTVEINSKFMSYGARPHKRNGNGGGDDLSGAYLFLPDGDAKDVPISSNDIVVLEGPIVSKVIISSRNNIEFSQTFSLYLGSHAVDIQTEVDIRSKTNFELALHFDSTIKSGDEIYTDLNGIQMIRRKRLLDKLPMQAHFYPMPGSAFIEDDSVRISLLGSQALGVASLKEGQIEVMLDRRLNQDDGRGVGQGVLDNKRTASHFRLLVEPLSGPLLDNQRRIGFHSMVSSKSSQEMHYPYVKLVSSGHLPDKLILGLKDDFPCDVQLVNLRTSAGPTDYETTKTATSLHEAALILYKPVLDCRSTLIENHSCTSNTLSINNLFDNIKSSRKMSLTMLYEGEEAFTVQLAPQDIQTVRLQW